MRCIGSAKPPRDRPRHAEDTSGHRLINFAGADRVYFPPGPVRPEQSATAEGRDREFAGFTLQLTKTLSENPDVTRADAQRAGFMPAHLNKLKPPGDLREGRVNDQLSGWAERAISLAARSATCGSRPGELASSGDSGPATTASAERNAAIAAARASWCGRESLFLTSAAAGFPISL